MDRILFGSRTSTATRIFAWSVVILAMTQIADIFDYYGKNQVSDVINTLMGSALVIILAIVLFRIMFTGRQGVEIVGEVVAEDDEDKIVHIEGAGTKTHYINLSNDPEMIFEGLKRLDDEPHYFWKQVNTIFNRSPYKKDKAYNQIRLYSMKMMQKEKQLM